jgi:WD40 repeat protein
MYVIATEDNKTAIVSTPKRRLVAIDVLTGKLVREFDTGGQGSVVQPALSPDMQSVAMGQPLSFGKDGTAKILVFDVESGKLKMSFPGPSANLSALSFSPDGKYLFSGSVDTTALMWDLTAK